MGQRIRIDDGKAIEFFRENDNFALFCHAAPDADTLCSASALASVLKKAGKRVCAYCPDKIPKKLSSFCDSSLFVNEIPQQSEYTLVSVDVASQKMLPNCDNICFALSIDHHAVNTVNCELLLLHEDYVATGEIVFSILDLFGQELDKPTAVMLYAAISSDSGGFRYDATRPQTHLYAARMLQTGIDFALINRILFEQKNHSQLELERLAYNSIKLFEDGKLATVTFTAEDLAKTGASEEEMEGISQIPRQIAGVEISALIRPKGEKIKVSLRSNGTIDVSAIAKSQNGGGHFHAAGFSVSDSTPAKVEETIVALAKKVL